MKNNLDIANLIFPDIKESINDLESRYKIRTLSDDAKVTRFAPSPTGFLHTGSLFTAMVGYKLAHDSNGIFYFRLEDTDTKREIKGSDIELLEQLEVFGIKFSEGVTLIGDIGEYGPYRQSNRESIYKTVIKQMLIDGNAYPCFCSKEELEELRSKQEEAKAIPGYYGEYAKCRNLTNDERYDLIKSGKKFVIRFKSKGDHNNKIIVNDEIRGTLELTENDQDIVILKSDNLPTYHFAHAVDDHFMHTTLITRGEEWLSSLPIHVELFKTLNFELPKYAHLPVIMKLDNGNKRKLSKRKDDEAAVSYFLKDGYPVAAILTYLMSIANSNFEEFLINNPEKSYDDFIFSLKKMSLDGALFDIEKLKYFAKEYLAKLDKKSFASLAYTYAKKYDSKLLSLIEKDYDKFENIINIEREKDNPRKDYACFKELYEGIKFFYNSEYIELIKEQLPFNEKFGSDIIINLLVKLKTSLVMNVDEQTWFASLKEVAQEFNFAASNKIYKKDPENYLGHVGDVAELLRIAITTRKQSPNLFCIMNILGKEECEHRLDSIIKLFK